eukprot:CAMPEP_0178482122 /NCGR_PEP_ID=MMETSP0696-20121128/6564_1 /TAXON_ID=265572 /ORGANISM="Extubocellulus spinifer, Strain CCMP396" /LENGTH=561 /DNA_ID=CAMNT_0020109615 /DNA_START=76 /DNA_END=1761 /DNA_ORIENTATION=+
MSYNSSEEDEQSDDTCNDFSDMDDEEYYYVHGHHSVRKLGHDIRSHSWGDGGSGPIEYPVYYCRSLFRVDSAGDNDACRRELTSQLRKMAKDRKDVQPNNVVHDIIDPSLNARVVPASERLALRTKWEEDFRRRTFQTCDDVTEPSDGTWRRIFRQEENQQHTTASTSREENNANDDDEYMFYGHLEEVPEDKRSAHENMHDERSAFQWVPTEVQLQCTSSSSPRNCHSGANNDGGGTRRGGDLPTVAKFMGPIPGLRVEDESGAKGKSDVDYKSVYANLEAVFSAALPLLDKVLPSRLRKLQQNDTKLQVVIKAQEYVQPPHSKYTGRWHTEGYSENIVAGVVYYLDVSEETTGGELSFRPRKTPAFEYHTTDGWRDGNEVRWSSFVENVPIRTGTAVAFANSIPHRFRSIRNDTDHAQRRLFLNFFVVDPATPLANTTTTLMGPGLARRALMRMGLPEESKEAGKPFITTILEYYGGYACARDINRKLLRDRARSAMAQDRPHWYETMHFGNSADLLYTGDARPMVPLVGYLSQHYNKAARVRDIEHSGANTDMLGSGM